MRLKFFGQKDTLSKYKVPCRTIASHLWGGPVQHTSKTNRKGILFYDTPGHGGYVCDDSALTLEEKKKLFEAGYHPEAMRVIIQYCQRLNDFVVLADMTPYATRRKKYSYNASEGPAYQITKYFWTFEEDCNWAYLAKYCGVYPKEFDTQERRDMLFAQAEKTLQWLKENT